MKNLSFEKMEKIQGGDSFLDCVRTMNEINPVGYPWLNIVLCALAEEYPATN